jgi:hypothetical protein
MQDLSRAVHSHGLELSVEELRDMARGAYHLRGFNPTHEFTVTFGIV